jgi:tRNA G18 (ribose-2'-O)-methylase SpoU
MDISQKKTMPELNRISKEEYAIKHQAGFVLILDNVRSAFNVGSIFRTGDGMGVSFIYLCGITCQTDNRELQKTALGAEMSVPSEYVKSASEAVKILREQGYTILVLEQTHNSILLKNNFFETDKKYAIVLGNEVEGVSDEVIAIADACIEIPQVGSKHSLNVANATSIVLWEYFKSRNYVDTI